MDPPSTKTEADRAVAEADATPPASRRVGSDSELRSMLKQEGGSALAKYMALVLGKTSKLALLNYELRVFLLTNLPGALGLWLRQKCYRSLFGKCGKGVVIGRGVTIRHPHRIRLGDEVIIDDNAVLDAKGNRDVAIDVGDHCIIGRNTVLSCKSNGEESGSITLEPRVNISLNCTLLSETSLAIGRATMIAGHCYLIAGGNHGIDRLDQPVIDQPMTQKGGVSIGPGSWLGSNATVLDGVRLGEGVVVAAGAVVRSSFDALLVVGGVPAKVLSDRRDKARQAAETGTG